MLCRAQSNIVQSDSLLVIETVTTLYNSINTGDYGAFERIAGPIIDCEPCNKYDEQNLPRTPKQFFEVLKKHSELIDLLKKHIGDNQEQIRIVIGDGYAVASYLGYSDNEKLELIFELYLDEYKFIGIKVLR